MRAIFWLVRRVVLVAVAFVAVAAIAAVSVYYAGIEVPIRSDRAPITYQNWNKTKVLTSDVDYGGAFQHRDGRLLISVSLGLPETAAQVQAFLDGGRTQVVACGDQKLFFHRLEATRVNVLNPVIGIGGRADMELDGFVKGRDDWALAADIAMGHDRTSLWADLAALTIADAPPPMVESLLEGIPRVRYTREQVLDLAAKSLPEDLAAVLATHRDALDLAFESITPSQTGDEVRIDATFSVNEGAVFSILQHQVMAAGGDALSQIASLALPRPAHAGFLDKLKEFSDSLDLEGGADQLIRGLQEGKSPEEILQQTLSGLATCEVTF